MMHAADTPSVLAESLAFPEGPAFDADGNLWFVELEAGRIARIDRAGSLKRFDVGGKPNGLAFDAHGRLWICDSGRNQVRVLDPTTGLIEVGAAAVNGQPLDGPNDLAFDTLGNLLFSCPGNSREAPTGYVCCLTATGECMVIGGGFYFPNGLALTSDGTTLIVAETRRQRLWRGSWNGSERNWDPAPWVKTSGPIGPDGLAVDADGRVFAAIYGAGRIDLFSPDGARSELPVSGANPTNCALDPFEDWGLIVTESERGQVLSFPKVRAQPALHRPVEVRRVQE